MIDNPDRAVIRGLKDVAAAETRISYVDFNGALYYLGYNIDDLVGKVTYAEVAYLLLHKELPNRQELNNFTTELVSNMILPSAVVDSIKASPKNCHPMDILRTEVSHLGEFDSDGQNLSDTVNMKRAMRLIAQVPVIVATIYRSRQGLETPEPEKEFSFTKNYLYLIRGEVPEESETNVLHRYMTLHIDHGFNASTFAARVTASTNSDMYSAVTSAIGTLKGPIHGGASEKVMEMLDDVNLQEEVDEYISGLLADQKKIMGFGHRIYRAQDPRTKHLRGMVEDLCHRQRTLGLYNKCVQIENIVYNRKKIYPNVDFYAAVTMDALGVSKEFFTPFFASSRITGWVSHIIEQYEDAVLLRPDAKYAGQFNREFIPIENR
ncbi:MAG: citrate synthase [Candidatus Bathyarchaeota archaeon]|nr:citrate synthase [Candidatus Bathyarchaeota archaeon]